MCVAPNSYAAHEVGECRHRPKSQAEHEWRLAHDRRDRLCDAALASVRCSLEPRKSNRARHPTSAVCPYAEGRERAR